MAAIENESRYSEEKINNLEIDVGGKKKTRMQHREKEMENMKESLKNMESVRQSKVLPEGVAGGQNRE